MLKRIRRALSAWVDSVVSDDGEPTRQEPAAHRLGWWLAAAVGGLVALGGVASAVRAEVTAFDVFYSHYYYQFSGTPPTWPYSRYFAARLTTGPGDVATASLTLPNATTVLPMGAIGPGSFLYQEAFFEDAGLLAAFPAGEYVCNAGGGALGPVQVQVTRKPEPYWPDAIPAYTPATITAMQNANAGFDLGLEFNAWAAPAPADFGVNFVIVYDALSGAVVYAVGFNAADTSHAVPAGTLTPGRIYNAFLYFSSRSQIFDGVLNRLVAYDYATYATLSTVACVGDLNRDSFVDDADFTIFAPAYDTLLCDDPLMPFGCPADLNRDGSVDDGDFVIFVVAYDALLCP
ncbi:MAG TPA: hypothetical protein VF777_12030 [Phycisphaerales bacterium]